MREILFLILITFSTVASGTNYYISNSGNDSSNGQTHDTAWKTLKNVNTQKFNPGDSILFERGGIWNENLKITSSGSSAGQITYSAYGTGDKPVFNGIEEVSGWKTSGNWTNLGNNVWRINLGSSSSNAVQVWLNNQPANRTTGKNVDGVTASNPWEKWDGLFYLYSEANPATVFSSIKQSSSSGFMRTYSKDYITISNIEVTGWLSTILTGCSHWIIEHCDWGWGNGEHGIRILREGDKSSLNGIIRHCTFDSGDRNPNTQSSPRWGSNTKQGLGFYEGVSNWHIHDNYFRAWGHVHVVIESRNGYPCEGNKIYDNYFTNMDGSYGRSVTIETHKNTLSLMDPNNPNEFYNNYTYKQCVQSQILGAYTKVYNNVWNIVKGRGNNPLVSANAISLDGYSGRTGYRQKIYNNVFAYSGQAGIFYPGYDTHEDQRENEVINNIFYNNGLGEDHRVDNQLYIGFFTPVTVIDNTFRNNIFYTDRDADKAIQIYKGYIDVSAFNSVSSGASNPQNHITSGNMAVDPLFVDPENGDFSLKAGSPAIGTGLEPLSDHDHDGVEWQTHNIGPFSMESTNNTEEYTLSVRKTGNGSVNVNGAEIESITVPDDTRISLEAIAAEGWKFSHWEEDLSGSVNPLEFLIDENKKITAVFTEVLSKLTVNYEGEGSVKITPAGEFYPEGTIIDLEAVPENGWYFNEWDGDFTSTKASISFTIEDDMEINAKFNNITTNTELEPVSEQEVNIYPNPAKNFFRIEVGGSSARPDLFRIIDLNGKIVHKGLINKNITDVQIPTSLNSGIYIVELLLKNLNLYARKIVISK